MTRQKKQWSMLHHSNLTSTLLEAVGPEVRIRKSSKYTVKCSYIIQCSFDGRNSAILKFHLLTLFYTVMKEKFKTLFNYI